MRMFGCSLIIIAGLAATAQAQTVEQRGTVAWILGWGRTWDDESNIGRGPVAGGRVDWRVFGNTRLEGSLDALSHDRSGGFFEAEGRTLLIGISLVQRFGSHAAQPYVLGGYHIANHSGSTTFNGVRSERDSTDHGFHFGGGFAVRIGDRLEVGPEARFYMIQAEDGSAPAMAYWIGGRLGVRF